MLIKNNKTTTTQKRTVRKENSAPAKPKSSEAWNQTRPAKVARAKKLLQNPNYPPGKVMKAVAKLLAEHLGE